jgi:hypothetical protein
LAGINNRHFRDRFYSRSLAQKPQNLKWDESGTGRDESGKSRDESAKGWDESAARASRQPEGSGRTE